MSPRKDSTFIILFTLYSLLPFNDFLNKSKREKDIDKKNGKFKIHTDQTKLKFPKFYDPANSF